MKIDTFGTCYNEERIMPYFLRHYLQYGDVYISDNYSTDNTQKIVEEMGGHIEKFNTNDQYDEITLQNIRTNCWKKSTADWVIVCDSDEFIYHENLIDILQNTNATLIIPEGYNMISDKFPTTDGQIYDEVKMGIFSENYCKPIIFKPSQIPNINFRAGSHFADPIGNVIIDDKSGIKLLHMKHMSKDYLIERYKLYHYRMSDLTKYHKFGIEYTWDIEKISTDFDDKFNSRQIVI